MHHHVDLNSILSCFNADLELNGTSYGDKGETPPPLPVKSNMGDYGNLMDNSDLASPTTPPPPLPHQRVKRSIHIHQWLTYIFMKRFTAWSAFPLFKKIHEEISTCCSALRIVSVVLYDDCQCRLFSSLHTERCDLHRADVWLCEAVRMCVTVKRSLTRATEGALDQPLVSESLSLCRILL